MIAIRWFLKLLFRLPERTKLSMAGGKRLTIRGNELNLDNQLLATSSAKGPQLEEMSLPKARKTFRLFSKSISGPSHSFVKRKPIEINAMSHSIPARLYTPKQLDGPSPLLLYFHGGGNVIGDLDSYDSLCSDFAATLNIRVLSVDYRLAPEHKFPAAAHDAFASYRWALENHKAIHCDVDQILIAGDSAGGYLATAACLQAIQQQKPLPKAQVLIYPICDYSTRRESYQLFAEGLILTRSLMDYFTEQYINTEEDKHNPLASPLLAAEEHLRQMPPTLITLAGFDPLYDEGLAYYEKLHALGVDIQRLEHLDLTHGFATMTGVLKRGNEAKDEIIAACQRFLPPST